MTSFKHFDPAVPEAGTILQILHYVNPHIPIDLPGTV